MKKYRCLELQLDATAYLPTLEAKLNSLAAEGWRLHTIQPPNYSRYEHGTMVRQTLILEKDA